MVNFEALNSFLALNALVCSMHKYTMRLPRSFWLGPRWEGICFHVLDYIRGYECGEEKFVGFRVLNLM